MDSTVDRKACPSCAAEIPLEDDRAAACPYCGMESGVGTPVGTVAEIPPPSSGPKRPDPEATRAWYRDVLGVDGE